MNDVWRIYPTGFPVRSRRIRCRLLRRLQSNSSHSSCAAELPGHTARRPTPPEKRAAPYRAMQSSAAAGINQAGNSHHRETDGPPKRMDEVPTIVVYLDGANDDQRPWRYPQQPGCQARVKQIFFIGCCTYFHNALGAVFLTRSGLHFPSPLSEIYTLEYSPESSFVFL